MSLAIGPGLDGAAPPPSGTPGAVPDVFERLRDAARRLPYAYRLGLAASLALYLVFYAALLTHTRALPYVMDNNESFSAFVHAANLYHFPFSRTVGLTDEAFSPSQAAHPYVYTHQGNFPRAFAFVLYALGARTIESHIVITTFTVGLLSVFLLYHYFASVASPLFAFIVAAVAMTDYIFFVQWQVNTFRVWHGLFLYLALLCVHGVGGPHRRRWLMLTAVAYACMFYFELVFAAFVAVLAGLYTGSRYWRRPRLLALCWSVQIAGAVLAVAILVGQLVAYLGWTDFLQDLRLTYTARNLVAQDPAYVERIREFVDSRHLVFWYNFASVEYQRSAREILSSITNGYFTAYTPTLWYLVTIIGTGWVASLRRGQQPGEVVRRETSAGVNHVGTAPTMIATLLLIAALSRFLLAVAQPESLVGVGDPRLWAGRDLEPWIGIVAAALGAALVSAIARIATGEWLGFRHVGAGPLAIAAGTALIAEHVVLNSAPLFNTFYGALWDDIHGTLFPAWLVQFAMAGAGFVAAVLAVNAGHTRVPSLRLGRFFGCGILAYVTVYVLSPGYIQSGYLERSVSFLSFLLQVAIALVLYLIWHVMARSLESARRVFANPGAIAQRVSALVAVAGCVCLLLFTALYWVKVQATHARLLPATHFGFMKQLREAPFRGASFAANTYAAPIYALTGQWAYFDTRLAQPDGGSVSFTDEGHVVNRDARSYLWLADRESNEEYQRPDYFLCFWYQDLRSAVYRLRGMALGCSSAGVVKHADNRDTLSVADTIVSRDASGRDGWSIVKLDWRVLDRPAARAFSRAGLE